jgi:tRNA-dihydrouridine synthase 1
MSIDHVYSLFANQVPDPVDISLEYLAICRDYPGTASLSVITAHIRHFVEFKWSIFPSRKFYSFSNVDQRFFQPSTHLVS